MATLKEKQLAAELSKFNIGKSVNLPSVDFSDPNRPKTCLEVDFPILPINEIAKPETSSGAARKPIYTSQKWWARRASSVFRGLLLSAATKAPEDSTYAAKTIWSDFYSNHKNNKAFNNLKVADIFMGGGTTLIEGSRLGLSITGIDLNPVAWFVVKQQQAKVNRDDVERLINDIENEVKPKIAPFFVSKGPNNEKGVWKNLKTSEVLSDTFDPYAVPYTERHNFSYSGPETIYTFWAKHGPCQVTGCGHRTPIISSPVIAIKTLSVQAWDFKCTECSHNFDVENCTARMAPDVPLVISETEKSFVTFDSKKGVVCPNCGHQHYINLGKGKSKKINFSLLISPEWLIGESYKNKDGLILGGSAQDNYESTSEWNLLRSNSIGLIEVRGNLPDEIICPITKKTISTSTGTVPKRSNYVCGSCGTVQDVLTTIKSTGKTGQMAGYTVQGYSEKNKNSGASYNGRFFGEFDKFYADQYNAAVKEWEERKDLDLAGFWPKEDLFKYSQGNTSMLFNQPSHGFKSWWMMFNPRQLLVHSQLLKAIMTTGNHKTEVREFLLGAFQQYLRANCMLSFWNTAQDCLEPFLGASNYHPKNTVVENTVFNKDLGRGSFRVYAERMLEALDFSNNPWDLISRERYKIVGGSGKTERVFPGDQIESAQIHCGSSTDLNFIKSEDFDLVITDPPFGALIHYSDLSDFFYPWLKIALKDRYPEYFSAGHTPKSLEVIANKGLEGVHADNYYQRLLGSCWKEAHRILKPGGILAFTFHHSEDEPWVAVLESLFDAGFYLEATYPIRSDETKGEGGKPGTFGSQTIEYDIIHVCRKRTEEPKPVSWGRMRREVMTDVRQLQGMLENHAKEGLPAADIQVIRRGKALEYFSRHYGKVYVDEGQVISVRDALIGINQLIDEDADKGKEAPPVNLEPMSRQFLRTFDGKSEIPRDQLQKFLKGSITTPDEFVQRGWCSEKNKVFTLIDPLDFARDWQGKHKRKLTSDLDQALVLIGACIDGSGINAADTLKNDNFKPHAALKPLLDWMSRRAVTPQSRNAAIRAITIYNNWAAQNQKQVQQMTLFFEET